MLTIEKIEGTIVVIEDDDRQIKADISQFDGKICEGDIVTMTPDGRYRKDSNATNERRRKVIDLQNSLWN